MENTGVTFDSAEIGAEPRRTPVEWVGLTALAMLVLVAGGFVGMFGPLLAIACGTCQDGVRTPGSGDALIVVAQYAVPLTTLGSVVGIFLPRGGARVGGIGLGVLMVLFVAMLVLGQ
ncbi:hypothetical protein [Streptomyces sp. NPDC001530]|uniref:hypothetical protein n=1 Tax=Streptomyces sp. NPDC001530 TaxID=3364582 RepID=UPI00367FB11A